MRLIALISCCLLFQLGNSQEVSQTIMQQIYEEIKTPYKYGLVMVPADDSKKIDCPSVFRKGETWYMTYIVFDGRGYETWLAISNDLLQWKTLGKIMSFSDTSIPVVPGNNWEGWDANQKAGYVVLQDYQWGGSYQLQKFQNKYWLSYIGGKDKGYEAGTLAIGIANTKTDPTKPHEWQRITKPVLTSTDKDVRWWENKKLFKSTVIWDKDKKTGYQFVMAIAAATNQNGAGSSALGWLYQTI